ncbi:uncharacterized protein [Oryza sativa Japonica Group]|uniref:Uncharacterized protein n=1 Tax=Oryza nivara TaxID=4536 RepID=A0A0E0HGJ8_ORYNI|nr:hypothetical protein DAI22_05g218700 [Oryza sativa Japonica Group]
MEVFENARSVRLRSHLGTYLCAADDGGGGGGEAVTHGYRRNCRGTVWAVETSGDDYVRLQGHRGLYLCATELPAALDGGCRGSAACCWVIQAGSPPSPNDGAFLWTPRREGEHLTLTGLYGRLLRARFGLTPRENAVTVDRDAAPEESSWVVEVVPESEAPPPRCRALSCDARLEAATSEPDTAFTTAFVRFYSAKELKVVKPPPPPEEGEEEEEPPSEAAPGALVARTIFYNTARDDGRVDDFDQGTWRYFTFKEQSLAALRRRLEEEARREDFVVCRRRCAAPPPGLFPVVLDLPPGNRDMEFVLVLHSSRVASALQFPFGNGHTARISV